MGEFKKCNKDGCCKFLAERLTDTGKGFHSIDTIILTEEPPTMHFRGIAYKTGAKDKGLMLNWCPFCGGQPGDFKRG